MYHNNPSCHRVHGQTCCCFSAHFAHISLKNTWYMREHGASSCLEHERIWNILTETWNTLAPVRIWTMIRAASVLKLIAAFRAETALSCALHVLLRIKYCCGHVYRDELTARKLIHEIWILRCKTTSCICIIQRCDRIMWVHSDEQYWEKLGKLMT